MGHRARERHALVERHAAKEHRHGESGGLSFADRAAREAGDEFADLAVAQGAPVAFGADDLLRQDHSPEAL